VEPKKFPSFTWMFVAVLLLVALPTFGVGVYIAATSKQFGLLAAGCACIVAVLLAWPLARAIESLRDANLQAFHQLTAPLNERVQQINSALSQICDRQLLSDRAKSVAYRDKDREALRGAINEEMSRQDWEAAMALANDIETEFGYKQEADRLRAEINQRWQEVTRRQINDVVATIDRHARAEQWQDAFRAAEKLLQQFPNDPQVRGLPQDIENRRRGRKQQLIDSLREAEARHDVDGGMELLRQLDLYLTPQEAEHLRDSARNVIREKLNSLRTQFSVAVQDHKWQEAISVGEEIMRDFPNTKIAEEVRERMDTMRRRANSGQEMKA